MGCAASTGPLYRDEHDFATTAAYYDKDDDVKKDWVENEQLGEGMFARVVKISAENNQCVTAVKSVYPIQPCKGVQLCLDEYIDWMNCVYSDICEEELTCEDEGMADDRCEGMLIWCDSANACTFPTSGAGGCPEFGSQFDNDDSAGGGDDHSGHDHDEGHSSDGATATTPAVLVAALAALAYA